jgi:hypothetical protein
MFICEPCEDKFSEMYGGYARSYGPCEVCGKVKDCGDFGRVKRKQPPEPANLKETPNG